MQVKLVLGLVAALFGTGAVAQDLARPPADARHYVIESTGGKHGDMWAWTAADGTRVARETWNLRGQAFDWDMAGKARADGMPASLTIKGRSPTGDAAETYSTDGTKGRWKSPVDAGSAPAAGKFYLTQGGPSETNAWFLEQLLARPDKTLDMLPGGKARAVQAGSAEVGEGAARQTVKLWAVSGVSTSPFYVWADAKDRFFGTTSMIAWLPEAYAGELAKLQAAQAAAAAKAAPGFVTSLVQKPTGPVAFTHVRLFDADGLKFLPDQTVVVEKGLITAVGPAASVKPRAGARVIDGRGMTLSPGLWDSHMHVGDDYTGLQELSMGVTSFRDPGNNDALTVDRLKRRAAGELLFPHVYPSSLIDGKGPYTAQVANVATSEAEALQRVREAKAKGMLGVKFYGTFNPAWLPAAIAEAHRLGLHVHGHVPAGLRPTQAIEAGYDEVTHINWIMMQAVPAEVLPVSNGIARFEAPGRYAKDVDLNGPALNEIVGMMAAKKIYSDPTMVAFEGLYVPESGELTGSYTPFVGTLPPTTERALKSGGFAVPKDLTRADYRASWAKMVALLGKMHRAGVPIVAGTDGSGLELVHELEIYVDAGFTPAEALAAATIVPARLVGLEARTGSIKVGKAADLVLVEGDPSQRIGDLRRTRWVMLEGNLLDADALRTAAGFSGRPK
jgi:imidazolonepropionase-like amidohydrolase